MHSCHVYRNLRVPNDSFRRNPNPNAHVFGVGRSCECSLARVSVLQRIDRQTLISSGIVVEALCFYNVAAAV